NRKMMYQRTLSCLCALALTARYCSATADSVDDIATAYFVDDIALLAQDEDECLSEEGCALSLRQLRRSRGTRSAAEVDEANLPSEHHDNKSANLPHLFANGSAPRQTKANLPSAHHANVSFHAAHAAKGNYGLPMINYPETGCTRCGEMAFCHRAENPGCGGHASGGVASFPNLKKGSGCHSTDAPILTIPRAYIQTIDDLKQMGGTADMLSSMLLSGFNRYLANGGAVPVMQCIHKSASVSVKWLHLHTFCIDGRVDGMPSQRTALCARMGSPEDAQPIAALWIR
ncbi:unnamed protein product, partial [Polarella glacialis]